MRQEEKVRGELGPNLTYLETEKKKLALTTAQHVHPLTQGCSGSRRRKRPGGKHGYSIKGAVRDREHSFTFSGDLMHKRIKI